MMKSDEIVQCIQYSLKLIRPFYCTVNGKWKLFSEIDVQYPARKQAFAYSSSLLLTKATHVKENIGCLAEIL